jgi:hypothetical protein
MVDIVTETRASYQCHRQMCTLARYERKSQLRRQRNPSKHSQQPRSSPANRPRERLEAAPPVHCHAADRAGPLAELGAHGRNSPLGISGRS